MSFVIWKYQLNKYDDVQEIEMPIMGEILSVQNQGGKLMMWVKVPYHEKDQLGKRKFLTLNTGVLSDVYKEAFYIGTVQFLKGAFIRHVFQICENG